MWNSGNADTRRQRIPNSDFRIQNYGAEARALSARDVSVNVGQGSLDRLEATLDGGKCSDIDRPCQAPILLLQIEERDRALEHDIDLGERERLGDVVVSA